LEERVLGRTGLRVNAVGFGGIPIQRVSEEEAVRVIRRCYELGINYFDTARGYTTSEERIGKALQGVRNEVILATKSHARTKKELLENLKMSLANLRTDHIDVYQLHNVSSEEAWEKITSPGGAIEGLVEARDAGRAKHIGVTSHNPELLTRIVEEEIFETAMIPFNCLATEPEERLLPLCKKNGVGTVIMKPFGGGAFSDANTALKYVLANEVVDIVIPGMMSEAEVEENVRVGGGDLALTDLELKVIEGDRVRLGNQFCRSCDYCKPCPQGIPISFVLRAEVGMLRRMGWTEGVVKQTLEAEPKVATCLKCGVCESRCPYKLPIRELLPQKMSSLMKRLDEKSIP
jgi:predicted aldo/keto reductase-like oxidoreductase